MRFFIVKPECSDLHSCSGPPTVFKMTRIASNYFLFDLNRSFKLLNKKVISLPLFKLSFKQNYSGIIYEEKLNVENEETTRKKEKKLKKSEKESFKNITTMKLIKADLLKAAESNRINFEKLYAKNGYSKNNDVFLLNSNMKQLIEHKEDVFQTFLSWNIDAKNIVTMFLKCPAIWSINIEQIQTTMKVLSKFMYTRKQAFDLLMKCPKLYCDEDVVKNLQRVIAELKSFGIEQKKCQIMTISNPDLTTASLTTIKNNFKNILEYFIKGEALLLVSKSSNVLTDSWEVNEFKLMYAFHKMGLTTKVIAQSKLFSHSVEDIITRHSLLERLGIYKKPTLKALDDLGDNPKQKEIFDENLFAFLKNTAKLQRNEYEAFKESIKNELKSEHPSIKKFFLDGHGDKLDEDESCSEGSEEEDDDDENKNVH